MNIAYILDTFPRESHFYLQREIDALIEQGFDVDIGALQAKSPARQLAVSAAHFWKKYFYPTNYAHHLARQIAAHSNAVHFHAGQAGLPARIAMAAAEINRVPWSFAACSSDFHAMSSRTLILQLENAAFVLARSRADQAFLQSLHPPGAAKVLLVSQGLPLQDFPFKQRQRFYPPQRILGVGPLASHKRFEDLLYAMKLLQNRGMCPEVTLLGDGPRRRSLEKLASVLKLTKLHFEGHVPAAKVRAYMQRASVLVAPRKLSHAGVPSDSVIEAAALGLPLILPEHKNEDLLDQQKAWFYPPRQPRNLAQLLPAVFAQPQETFCKTQRARLIVEEHYDVTRNTALLADALRRGSK